MWLFAVFIGLPLVEIALFVTVGGWIGLWPTLAIVIGTGILGLWLIRRQGDHARRDLQAAMASRGNPGPALASDALVVVAGGLLFLPGFLTDTLGALLLLPPVQRAVIAYVASRAKAHAAVHLRRAAWQTAASAASQAAHPAGRQDDIIDGTWEELPDDTPRPPSGWTKH